MPWSVPSDPILPLPRKLLPSLNPATLGQLAGKGPHTNMLLRSWFFFFLPRILMGAWVNAICSCVVFVCSVLWGIQLCTGRLPQNSESQLSSSVLADVSILTKGPKSPQGVCTTIWPHLFRGSVATAHRGQETTQWQGTLNDISVSGSLAAQKA